MHRHTADKLRDQPVFRQILGHHLLQQIVHILLLPVNDLRVKADGTGAQAVLHHLLEPVEGSAADKQDVGRVDLEELLLRVLSASLGRNAGHRALQNLKERLRDLIDVVAIDNSVLRATVIIIRRLDDLQKNILHVLAHVARLGERGGVGDGKGDI